MKNEDLKAEADSLMTRCEMGELLASYPEWFVGGSYYYDLMCWRDLDIYVLDPLADLKRCFKTGYELTKRLDAKKCRFTNNVGDSPNGLYWGLKLGDVLQGAWKLDVWFLDQNDYGRHVSYCANMVVEPLTKDRESIIAIKESYWKRPEYRDTVTSDMIYRAVLVHKISTVEEFEEYLRKPEQ